MVTAAMKLKDAYSLEEKLYQAPSAEGPGFDPWLGNYIPHAATKSWHSQTNKFLKKS